MVSFFSHVHCISSIHLYVSWPVKLSRTTSFGSEHSYKLSICGEHMNAIIAIISDVHVAVLTFDPHWKRVHFPISSIYYVYLHNRPGFTY